jgi:pimeloyl-ACP methyl ester carboxylesterase
VFGGRRPVSLGLLDDPIAVVGLTGVPRSPWKTMVSKEGLPFVIAPPVRQATDVDVLGGLSRTAKRYTLSPLISRAIWPLMMAKIFGRQSVPGKFGAFPKEMALRPSQIRASAAESALMIPDAFKLRYHYPELKMPVAIIAGEQDRLIDIDTQSGCIPTFRKVDFTALPETAL